MSEQSATKIMIVDDAGYIRVLFKEALKKEGYEIVTSHNLLTAYELILREKPDLLLLDINLPDGSGIDLLKELRKQKLSIPVIMITAVSTKESVIDASQYGISSYITKPVDLKILKQRIREALNK